MKVAGKIINFSGSCDDGEVIPMSLVLDLHPYAQINEKGIERALEEFNRWKLEKTREIVAVNFCFKENSQSISAGRSFVISVLYLEE